MYQASSSVLAVTALLFAQASVQVLGDLRMGSTPKRDFVVKNEQNAIKFTTTTALYMEPSTFGYQGLVNQKNNNYDNFLRSNVDNEQDNRNFNNEDGKDMLPFRTSEASTSGDVMTMKVGEEVTIPLRWNNPHSSECEVNVWIRNNDVVVPIKKPVCCGEGYQDAVITATIPDDFNQLISKVPGFEGCIKPDDCVLQIYAHSVEPRIYAIGVPLIVQSDEDLSAIPKATNENQIEDAAMDPGMDFEDVLSIATCRPSYASDANLQSAIPRWARHTSDVYNHAYQNSDYSPYMGQQHERISMNLQAAVIIEMLPANRGELGQSILSNELKSLAQNLRNKVNTKVKRYENIANNLFGSVGGQLKYRLATVGNQPIADCFRCAEVGSVNHNRLQTQTYIPSFPVPANLVQQVWNNVQSEYRGIVDTKNNAVTIYTAVLKEMKADFAQAQQKGLDYMPAPLKTSAETMPDATSFKKIDANGNKDGGVYAATKAKNTPPVDPASVHVSLRKDTNVDTKDYTAGINAVLDDEAIANLNVDGGLPSNPDDDVVPESVDEEEDVDGSSAASLSAISFFMAVPAIASIASLL